MVRYPPIDLYDMNLSSIDNTFENNRNELRKLVVNELFKEIPGIGKGDDASYYRYNVERLLDGNKIFITRPANLKNGFDFLIHVENHEFLNGKDTPRHDDIIGDLQKKKAIDEVKFEQIKIAIDRIYGCEDSNNVINDYLELDYFDNSGLAIDVVLKIVKWFFIEQDIRYWNYSGRKMFKDGVDAI